MKYTNEKKDAIIIFSGNVARQLLKQGYQIIDVKPDKTNKIKTIFVFKRENDIEKALYQVAYKDIEEQFTE